MFLKLIERKGKEKGKEKEKEKGKEKECVVALSLSLSLFVPRIGVLSNHFWPWPSSWQHKKHLLRAYFISYFFISLS
jgi:hypothetical protein